MIFKIVSYKQNVEHNKSSYEGEFDTNIFQVPKRVKVSSGKLEWRS